MTNSRNIDSKQEVEEVKKPLKKGGRKDAAPQGKKW